MAKATCSGCGKPVYRSPTSRPEITCRECRRKQPGPYGYGRRPSKYQPKPCAKCGEIFQPKSKMRGRPPQQYCSLSCANRAKWEDGIYAARVDRSRLPGVPAGQGRKIASRRRRLRHQATWDGIGDQEILERDRWMCWICKRRIGKTFKYPHARSASIDHIVPLSLGGDDTAFNKKAAHLGCNMARGNGRRGEQMTINFSAA